MVTIETNDVQGVILRGYGRLSAARFVLLHAADPGAARQWLKSLVDADEIAPAVRTKANTRLNIAFTHAGLVALGLGAETLTGFSQAFQEGMAGDYDRGRSLGDHGQSAPQRWDWGGPRGGDVHAVLLLYASDDTTLAAFHTTHAERFAASGWRALRSLDTVALAGRKEHFGFRDGISQPRIQNDNPVATKVGVLKPGQAENTIAAGEVLLGYRNEYGLYPNGPLVSQHLDPQRILPLDAGGSGRRDFGRNGSYLVLRQLEQDVPGFWTFVRERAGDENFVELAAKMVGRWPNGAPLVKAPHGPVDGLEDDENFAYADSDATGDGCPLGSHLRRANPRDAFGSDADLSVQITKRHRIVRRGRPYGAPVDPSLDPERMLAAPQSPVDRGLHFLGFNADLERQFEFIYQNWLNNPKFGDLYDDKDPLLGDHPEKGGGQFCLQSGPVRRRVIGLPRFVHVRGGAYFFTPGLAALRYLANLPSTADRPSPA